MAFALLASFGLLLSRMFLGSSSLSFSSSSSSFSLLLLPLSLSDWCFGCEDLVPVPSRLYSQGAHLMGVTLSTLLRAVHPGTIAMTISGRG